MADVKRTRFYAEANGLTIDRKTGEYHKQTVRVTGRFKTKEAAEKSIRRHYKDFLPSDVRLGVQEYVMTPEVHAAIDVNALAVLFNEDYAKTNQRIIDISGQDIGINGFQCILTTREFFFCWDYYYGTQGGVVNPISLGTNYFLHHKEAISLSPFVPAILFWTGEGTREDVEVPAGATASKPEFQIRLQKYGNPAVMPTNVTRGDVVQVVSTISMDGYPDFAPNGGIIYEIASDVKSQFTKISNTGILRVGLDETANYVDVRARATYKNPRIPEVPSVASDTLRVPIVGDGLLGFNPGFVTNLEFSPRTPVEMGVGEDRQLHVVATMTDGRMPDVTNMVTWSSSDESVVKVSPVGKITGVSAGTATIEVTVFAVTQQIQVTVTAGGQTRKVADDSEK